MPSEWCAANGVAQIGISRLKDVLDVVSTQASGASFRLTVDAIEKPAGWDFRGPYVYGKLGERFLYVCWGRQTVHGWMSENGGRTKLQLGFISQDQLDAALAGRVLVADLTLSNDRGKPALATVRAPTLVWRLGDSRE